MAVLFNSWSTEFFFTIFFAFFLYYLYFKFVASKFWKSHNVVHLEPRFILGNVYHAPWKNNFALVLAEMYENWKKCKVVGFWNFTTPVLLLADPDLIKRVLTKDFNHFRDRGIAIDFDHDVLAANLFNVGGRTWRNLRVRLTPTFSSGKMKMMFPMMVKCAEELQEYLGQLAAGKKVEEVKEILAKFTTDIISSCAFGIQTNSLKNPNSEFRKYGRKIFETNFLTIVNGIIINFSPKLFKLLKFRFTPKDVSEFFLKVIGETIEYREKTNVKRNDFMQLLIQLKNKGRVEDADAVSPHGDQNSVEDVKFSVEDAAAQAFVFFAAGFETSSTTLTFALYELALNDDIQNALQKEIDDLLEEHEGKMTYEGVMELEYLDKVVQESLRKYPPVSFIFRKCNKDYEVPELGVSIPKDVVVMIPVFGIHKDPEYYADPEKFDPDRHSPEEKAKRHQFVFLPFGEGPRNCIGSRFGLMQTKIGLVAILSRFNVKVTKETPIPLSFDKLSFILSSSSGVPLSFHLRSDKFY